MEKEFKVTFYIDGFNFYYGLKRAMKLNGWENLYWIDMVALCKSFLGDNQKLEKVIYFTASPLNPQKNSRQSAFLNANKLLNGNQFEIVRGKYFDKPIQCPLCKGTFNRPEEKKTDVNISVRMIKDCVEHKTDLVSLVSADTDIIPPLEVINSLYPNISIKVYFPPTNYSNDMKDFLHGIKRKPVLMIKNHKRFVDAKMPDVVDKDGKQYTIPNKWK